MKDRHRKLILFNLKIMAGVLMALVILMFYLEEAKASTTLSEDINYTEIQEVIDDIMEHGNAIDFRSYVDRLMQGKEAFSLNNIGTQLIQSIKGEVKANLGTFARLISIALIAAIFTNLSMAFKHNQVCETGYYITYLLLFALLMSSFVSASVIAASAIGNILDFMKVLVPAYCMSVGFASGSASSLVYYEVALFMITVVDLVLIKIVIPLINFYMVIMLANNLSKEDMLSKLAGLFETIIRWLLKSLLAAVIGFQAVQGLIIPVADRVKRSALLRASQAIPGVGTAIGGVTQTVISAGVLLKNSIGVAGLVIIIIICAIPLLKLIVIALIYKCGSAALQPVSDKRMIECISASAKSAEMLLHTLFVGAVLFLLSITIVAVTTSGAI